MKLDIKPVNKELRKALDSITFYDKQSFKRIEKALDDGIQDIESGAKRRVPRKSGKLYRSIFSRMNKTILEGYVGAKAPHAHLVEHGVKAKEIDLSNPDTLSQRRKRKGTKALTVKAAPTGNSNSGFATKIRIPARAKRPFMSPAFEEARPGIVRALEQAVQPNGVKS